MKGSLTVEASYIFPFCFLVIGVVCLLGIFCYNQAVLEMTGYECILQIMEEKNQEDVVLKENLIRKAKTTAEDRTIGIENLEVLARVTSSKISLTFWCEQSLLRAPIETTVIYEMVYPELTLRLTRGIGGE